MFLETRLARELPDEEKTILEAIEMKGSTLQQVSSEHDSAPTTVHSRKGPSPRSASALEREGLAVNRAYTSEWLDVVRVT